MGSRSVLIDHDTTATAADGPSCWTSRRTSGPALVVVAGPDCGAVHHLEQGPCFIGRAATNTLAVDDAAASRTHCTLEMRGGDAVLTDLGSRNGTWAGGVRLSPHTAAPIGDGTIIELGNTVLKYVVDGGIELGLVANLCERPSTPSRVPSDARPLVRLLGPTTELVGVGRTKSVKGVIASYLVRLALSRGPTRTEWLIEELWPEVDEPTGRNRLHMASHRLRRALECGDHNPVVASDGTVTLEPGPALRIDLWELEDLLSERAPNLSALFELYRGDLLHEQFAYDDHVSAAREDLRSRFAAVAASAIRSSKQAGALAEAEESAARLCHLIPEDPALCLLVLDVLAASGDPTSAVGYVRATARLLDEWGHDVEDVAARAAAILDPIVAPGFTSRVLMPSV